MFSEFFGEHASNQVLQFYCDSILGGSDFSNMPRASDTNQGVLFNPLDFSGSADDVIKIIKSIRRLLIYRWLYESGYGAKILARYRQLEYSDPYGDTVVSETFFSELETFLARNLSEIVEFFDISLPDFIKKYDQHPSLEGYFLSFTPASYSKKESIEVEFRKEFEESVSIYVKTRANKEAQECPEDPILYEHFVASKFRESGWNAVVTKMSGDQGADVLCDYGNKKIVVQCKRYSSNVNNSAVQEAYSAKVHYSANYAVVVSNTDFTRSARELANSTGVSLLHHSQIADYLKSVESPDFNNASEVKVCTRSGLISEKKQLMDLVKKYYPEQVQDDYESESTFLFSFNSDVICIVFEENPNNIIALIEALIRFESTFSNEDYTSLSKFLITPFELSYEDSELCFEHLIHDFTSDRFDTVLELLERMYV